MFKDKILLITGGTGSFGNAVLNRFLTTEHFKEIRIFSRDEKKQDDMRNQLKNDKKTRLCKNYRHGCHGLRLGNYKYSFVCAT